MQTGHWSALSRLCKCWDFKKKNCVEHAKLSYHLQVVGLVRLQNSSILKRFVEVSIEQQSFAELSPELSGAPSSSLYQQLWPGTNAGRMTQKQKSPWLCFAIIKSYQVLVFVPRCLLQLFALDFPLCVFTLWISALLHLFQFLCCLSLKLTQSHNCNRRYRRLKSHRDMLLYTV